MTHTTRRFSRSFLAASAALLLLGPAVVADDTPTIELQIQRPKDHAARSAGTTGRPAAKGLPSRVLIQTPEAPAAPAAPAEPRVQDDRAARGERDDRSTRGGRDDRRLGPRPGATPGWPAIDRQADNAGRHAAEVRMRREGRREYFRLGFYEGLHAAFDNEHRLGRWDHRQGLRDGRSDPAAHSTGRALGHDDAERLADERATARVEAQFLDLSREPRYRPQARAPQFATRLPSLADPVLERVFDDHRWHGSSWIEGRDWLDPWELYLCRSLDDAYRDDWASADAALHDWRRRHRDTWKRWSSAERARFEHRFLYAFHHRLAQLWDRARIAYDRGYADGWDYGATLVADWSYRRGYHEGYAQALSTAARNSFDATYPRAYERRYRFAFDDWSSHVKPVILEARLFDGDQDGVFEPGETVVVRYRLANYGGAAGATLLAAQGAPLIGAAREKTWLPRRTVLEGDALELRIAHRAPVRSNGHVLLRAESSEHRLDFRVANALQLTPDLEVVSHHSLTGRLTVALEMFNESRRAATGYLVLRHGSRHLGPFERKLGTLEAGERRRHVVHIDGLDTLDLLAGTITLDAEIHSQDGVLDHRRHRLPELASRRANHELVDYLMAVARGERSASASEIRRAQELMIHRLRHDWKAAVAADGNPYRRDLRNANRAGAETALGELVQTVKSHRRALVRREVFYNLVPQIEALADALPGSHPFLRRSMKRLGRELRA